MLTVRCCAQPPKHESAFKLPKRLARARRVAESKRMDTLRNLHEALKKTAKDEHEFVKDLFVKRSDAFAEATADDEDIEKSE